MFGPVKMSYIQYANSQKLINFYEILGWEQGADDNFKRTDWVQFGNQLDYRGNKAIQIFVPCPICLPKAAHCKWEGEGQVHIPSVAFLKFSYNSCCHTDDITYYH